VKELVVACMLLAARNIGPAWQFALSLSGDDAERAQGNWRVGIRFGANRERVCSS
jgi:hypothetical protein